MYKTTFPRVLDTIIRPYLRSRSRKPYTTQVREMAALYRAYRYVPYHYFKHDLYSRAAPENLLDHIPPRILYAYIRSLNPDEGVRIVRNKITFRQVLSAHGLPVVTEVFHIDRQGRIFDAVGASIEAAEARALALAQDGDLFVKPIDGTHGAGAFRLAPADMAGDFPAGWQNILVQPALRQHHVLAAIYPHALNTVRIDTLRTETGVIHNAAILRMGSGGAVVDNGSAGGMFTGIDLETGGSIPSRAANRCSTKPASIATPTPAPSSRR